jgi:WD40 repeat protein
MIRVKTGRPEGFRPEPARAKKPECHHYLKTLNGHSDSVCHVEKHLNNQVLSFSLNKTIKVWDIDTGLWLKTFNNAIEISCLKILSESDNLIKHLLLDSNQKMEIWNIYDGPCIKTFNCQSEFVRN